MDSTESSLQALEAIPEKNIKKKRIYNFYKTSVCDSNSPAPSIFQEIENPGMVVLAFPGFFTFGCLKTASKDGVGMFSRSNLNFLLSSETLTMLLKEQMKLGVFSGFMLHITAAYVCHC